VGLETGIDEKPVSSSSTLWGPEKLFAS